MVPMKRTKHTWPCRCNVVSMLRAEKALPEEAVCMNWDKCVQSSISRCRVLDTREEIARYESASTCIQVGRDRFVNMDRTFSTISLRLCQQRPENIFYAYGLSDRRVVKINCKRVYQTRMKDFGILIPCGSSS